MLYDDQGFLGFSPCVKLTSANILELCFVFFPEMLVIKNVCQNMTWMQVGKTPRRLSATLVLLPYLSSFSPYKPDFA